MGNFSIFALNILRLKTIVFVRHAKSSWTDINMSDFDRPLDDRGLHDAPVMAKRLAAEGLEIGLLITSAANRARSTAKYFEKELGLPLEETRDLYHGMPEDYLQQIHMADDNIAGLALFGHNPGITYLANMIEADCTDNVPTCGVIIATSDADRWRDVDFGNMRLIKMMVPKDKNHG